MKNDFGAYELRKQIGKGGMAWVYLAVHKALDSPVAIKILFPHLAEDEKLVARFEHEARAAAKMRHENIVQVFDAGKFEDQPYIAMEYVDGLNLRQWLEKNGTPPIEVAVVLLRDLCRGLEHAHGRKIVHRDIKPANVMLTAEGTIKLMDFGLARGAEDHTVWTEHGAMVGTVPYMSPEQSLGQHVEKSSDIFSLGVVCYELLGGQRPFTGESLSAITEAIQHREPRPLTVLNPLVPDRMMAAIEHMLEKDSAKRCQSIAEVRQVLDELIVEMGIFQDRALLTNYAQAPQQVGQDLAGRRLAGNLERGAALERERPGAIERAIREYQCALHLDPASKVAKAALARLAAAKPKPAAPAPQQTPAPKPRLAPKPGATRAPASPAQQFRTMLIAASALLTLLVATIAILVGRGCGKPPGEPPVPKGPVAVAPVTPLGPRSDSLARQDATAMPATPGASGDTSGGTPQPPPPIPPRATLEVRTDPAGATVSVDDSLGQASPAIFRDLPGGRRKVKAMMQGYRDTTRNVRFAAGRDTVLTLVLQQIPREPRKPRALTVETYPLGASVSLDGGPAQPSPARFSNVAPGVRTLSVTLGAYLPVEQPVAFSGDRDSSLSIRLKPVPGAGFVSLHANPAGDFFVDNALRVANRDSAYIAVFPGKHLIQIRDPLEIDEPRRNQITLSAGSVKPLWVNFDVGFLRVTTSDGAEGTVILGSRRQPYPAPRVFPVKPGTYKVQLERAGFATVENVAKAKVSARETVTVNFTWKKP